MPASILDPVVTRTLAEARTPQDKDIRVGTEVRTIRVPFPSPQDWRDVWIYHLMLDRFNNPQQPPRDAWNRKSLRFQGGRFNGVRDRLDYLKGLGVGALWISPFLKNCQYLQGTFHGYGIQDFLRLDPRFASAPGKEEEELRALVDEAHARDIYVIADIVLNHAGDVFQYRCDGDPHCEANNGSEADWKDPGEYAVFWRGEDGAGVPGWTEPPDGPGVPRDAVVWPRELQENRFFRRKGRGGEAGGDFASLKEFVTARREVRSLLIRAHQFFVARYDVDGFRIDTLKYVERDFARVFGNAMREFALSIGKKNFLTFGEVWDSEERIAEFVGRYAREAGDVVGVDAALDFPLQARLPGMAKGFTAPSEVVEVFRRRKEVQRGVISSHGDASRFFVTFLDNHDMKRRFRHARSGQFDDQITLGLGVLFTLQGIPCVYYGTEQGLNGTEEVYEPGAGFEDWMVREALWGKPGAFDPASPFYRALQGLTGVRDRNPALRYGRQYFRPLSGNRQEFGVSNFPQGVLAFSRILNEEEAVVLANTRTGGPGWSGYVIIDRDLNPEGVHFRVLFSNKGEGEFQGPDPAETAAGVVVHETDGGTTHGPVRVVKAHLKPMEVQILGR